MRSDDRRGTRRARPIWAVLSLLLLAVSVPSRADDSSGFMYARVTMETGTVYEGRVRWGTEEAFWGDFFNSTKTERPYLDAAPKEDRYHREPIKVFGITIGSRSSYHDEDRVLKIRFGDIREIQPRRGDEATLIMKDGTEMRLEGGSNDLGESIVIWDNSVGEVEAEWGRIDRIEFLSTPADLDAGVQRLHGTVQTDEGEFVGFIQWDQDEGLSTDKLDGESRDGSFAIPMGNIKAIERHSSDRARVTLRDGRELLLGGTNDVNDENRGIFVEDPRYGRVLISWDAFERVDFSTSGDSGPGYEDYSSAAEIRGKVTDVDGRVHRGKIVWDLDESAGWEFLDGDGRDISYSVPFDLIKSVEPRGDESSLVVLEGGVQLKLEDAADVGEGNAGLVIINTGGDEIYVPWRRVKRVDFD